ncbi:hypothetical protein H072_8535 [Dactylellina haptotyla CBS 200.50]|uniref:Extracellular membrane protein CFEM domain-containing protein n=1 Tax=Dactylellina haptotyla (strain CBS 200.50) TaxID=1284197 RepID=S8BR48_DACHA|nr:hypothetical protein H072_8535 [Dactylellina haptotyla CBS 200.50]
MVNSLQLGTLLVAFCFVRGGRGAAQETAPVSIWDEPVWSSQRNCAQYCFGLTTLGPGFYTDAIGSALGCPGNPAQNGCWCRKDLTETGILHLSRCILSECASNTVDVESATSLYLGYCATAYTTTSQQRDSNTNSAAPGSSSGSTPKTAGGATVTVDGPTVTVGSQTVTVYASGSSSSQANAASQGGDSTGPPVNNSSGGLSNSGKIGLGVGLGVGALVIVGALFWFLQARRRNGSGEPKTDVSNGLDFPPSMPAPPPPPPRNLSNAL